MFAKGKFSQFTKLIACCAIVVYIVIFVGIFVVVPLFEAPEAAERYGDLAGRFQPEPTLNYKGQEYVFRSGEVENILLLGVDGNRDVGRDARLKGQADFLLLLSIDRKNHIVTPLIIDRDAMAQVQLYGIFGDPAGTDVMQICLAHTFSNDAVTGGENTLQAVRTLLGELPIKHYITIDIPGIVCLNDAVGGVEVTLQDDFSHLDPAMQKGNTLLLKGAQAEFFIRGRMNVASGTNHFRVQRQMQYLTPLFQKLSTTLQTDDEAIDTLFTALENHLESSFSRAEMIRLLGSCSHYDYATPIALQGSERLGTDKFIEFWLDWDHTAQLLIDICYEGKGR